MDRQHRVIAQRPLHSRRSLAQSYGVLLIVVVLALWGLSALLPRLRHVVQGTLHGDALTAGGAITCRTGDVLASAHKGGRLILQEPCVTAFGRVALVFQAHDGDTHISLFPDRGFWHLLDRRNLALQGATLVVEVAPADQGRVAIPSIGAHIRVTGALVTDRVHGWHEIHPTWQVVRVP